jgi:hypothetical protein
MHSSPNQPKIGLSFYLSSEGVVRREKSPREFFSHSVINASPGRECSNVMLNYRYSTGT